MAQGAWIKLSVGWDEDERIAVLPPLAQLTYLKVLTRAKRQRPQGSFGSIEHLRTLVPANLHKHLPTLVKVGLLFESNKRICVDNFSKYQVDPSATERSNRFRMAQRNGFATQMQRTEIEKEKEREKEKDTLTKQPMQIGKILRGGI
jgi:hypothetical protein